MDGQLSQLLAERLGQNVASGIFFLLGIATTALGILWRIIRVAGAWALDRRQQRRDEAQNARDRQLAATEQLQAEHRRELEKAQRHIAGTYQALVDDMAKQRRDAETQYREDMAAVRRDYAETRAELIEVKKHNENCQREVRGLQETIDELREELARANARIRELEGART